MTEIVREIKYGVREDGASIHLIERVVNSPVAARYVVCWNLKIHELNQAEWDWGTYLDTYHDAHRVWAKKCDEHDMRYDDDWNSDCSEFCSVCDGRNETCPYLDD